MTGCQQCQQTKSRCCCWAQQHSWWEAENSQLSMLTAAFSCLVFLLDGRIDKNSQLHILMEKMLSEWKGHLDASPNLLRTRSQHLGTQIPTEPKPPPHGKHPRSCRESASELLPHCAARLAKYNPNNTHPWLISISKPKRKLGGCASHLGLWDH